SAGRLPRHADGGSRDAPGAPAAPRNILGPPPAAEDQRDPAPPQAAEAGGHADPLTAPAVVATSARGRAPDRGAPPRVRSAPGRRRRHDTSRRRRSPAGRAPRRARPPTASRARPEGR